jgi:putative Mg2+ transporter-C (MgtC) family protein
MSFADEEDAMCDWSLLLSRLVSAGACTTAEVDAFVAPDWSVLIFRLVLAGVCGAAVGFEREFHDKRAGLRTHTLICMGACLFTLVCLDMREFSRLVQGLLTGIGFIGAGVIFRRGEAVKGLTTAAGLWALTGVGLAVGLGNYFLAVAGTALMLGVIVLLKSVEEWLHRPPEAETFVRDVTTSLAGKAKATEKGDRAEDAGAAK